MHRKLPKKKTIALVAHDKRKDALLQWCKKNAPYLKKHNLCATGTTGKLLETEIDIPVRKFLSGPMGGDFQIGSALVEGQIDMLIFFWDPLETLGHDPDVKALLRLSTLYNIPMACNETSADFFIHSSLFNEVYTRNLKAIEDYSKTR